MGKKKKQGRRHSAAATQLAQEEAKEELLALQAIFDDDIEVHEGHGNLGFKLRVVPHPGDASANYVSVRICVSYPNDYPSEELILKLTDASGLEEAAVRRLSKSLHLAAAQFATDGEICAFQLATMAQEFLQQHNIPPDEVESVSAAAQSLWHEMLQRDMASAASMEHSFRAPVMGDTFFDSLDGGGLFSDSAGLPVVSAAVQIPAATAGVPVVEVRSKQAARPPKPPPRTDAAGEASLAPATHTAARARAAAAVTPIAVPEHQVTDARGKATVASGAGSGTLDTIDQAPAAPAAGAEPALPAGSPQAGMDGEKGGRLPHSTVADMQRGLKAGQDGRLSSGGGGGNSMLKTLGHSLRGVLPKALRKYMDGSGAVCDGSEAGEGSVVQVAEEDQQLIRQELFIGHLLTLAASSGAVPPHALPSVATMLQNEGLIPKWLAFTLTQQPMLFDRAFQRVFKQELEAAAQQPEESKAMDPMHWAVQRFWKRRAAPLVHSRSPGHHRSRSGMLSLVGNLPASRYETDFTELRTLGRGGYGVVVSAINRLDGRQYAVKKIALHAHSAGAYERIMREVTTLSRLQHANVVRYYQAWVEASTLGDDSEGEGELDEWGSSTLTPSSSSQWGTSQGGLVIRPGSAGAMAAAGTGSRTPLEPVAEVSREGRASTPSKGTRWIQEASSETVSKDGSSSGASGESSTGSELAAQQSASFGLGLGGGNLAVAGANFLMSTHGSNSQLDTRASSSFLSAAWDTQSDSQSHSASQSQPANESQERGTTLPAQLAGTAPIADKGVTASAQAPFTGSGSGDFNFDRSRLPTGGHGGASLTQPSATQPSRRSGQRQRAVQHVLFISMEYCPRTLRDVLDSGELDEERRWHILRQILAGLAHIHSQGIIHRDLKPANTFLDSQGNVKLGDFGLAKYNRDNAEEEGQEAEAPPGMQAAGQAGRGAAASGGGGGGASALLSDTTGLVGTSYYISPEISQGWASYDAKVDLFSLGVMAFELWHPFATAMERAVLLRDLREHGVMPATFEADFPVVCRLIRWLLAPNPAGRPTAVEVLRSELLPPQVLDEQLTDLLRCLPDNPAMHERVLDAVFSLARTGGSTTEAAVMEGAGAPIPVQMAVRDHVLSVLKECFERHGAVGMCSQELGLATGEEPPTAVHLLTPAGTKVALRWELRQAFVAWYVHQVAAGSGGGSLLLDGLRRYEVAAVQRHAAGQGLPRSFLQADLDFVLPGERTPAELLLGDAEVITCTHEALAELPECGEVEVRLGHRSLFELALAFVGVSREARGSVIQLLSTASAASPRHATARSKRWPSIKAGLEGMGLSPGAIGRCRQLVLQAAGDADSALFRLRTLLAHTVAGQGAGHRSGSRSHSATAALACLDEVQQLVQYVQAWGLPQGSLLVDPLLAPHTHSFSGCLFQCHIVQGDSGATAVVAAGGRYDSLLKASWARQSALSGTVAAMPPLHAVGVTLNIDRVVAVAQTSSRWRTTSSQARVACLPRLSQADVLVCSRGGGGLLKERMSLARSLWDAGVAAEMLPQAAPSLTQQYEYAQSRGISWLVIISPSTFEAADTVRVKAMHARLEEDVSVTDLPNYLVSALHPHSGTGAAPGRTTQQVGSGRVADEGDATGEQEEPAAHGSRERQRRGGRR